MKFAFVILAALAALCLIGAPEKASQVGTHRGAAYYYGGGSARL